VVESGPDDMGLDGAVGVREAVRANPNTTKRSKKNLQYPFRFSPENLHKHNPTQNKNEEIKPKKLYCYEPTKRGEIRN
jgi:hypothetical protein